MIIVITCLQILNLGPIRYVLILRTGPTPDGRKVDGKSKVRDGLPTCFLIKNKLNIYSCTYC